MHREPSNGAIHAVDNSYVSLYRFWHADPFPCVPYVGAPATNIAGRGLGRAPMPFQGPVNTLSPFALAAASDRT